jgi:hypothetical protein
MSGQAKLIWTAWNNGRYDNSGNGYGLKVPIADRDKYFSRSAHSAILVLPDLAEIAVNTGKESFWSETCRELISKELGRWFIRSRLAPWASGNPPKIRVTSLGNARFKVEGLA